MSTYITDGTHLYQVLATHHNHGLAAGTTTLVQDCSTEQTREMSDLETRACRPVQCS